MTEVHTWYHPICLPHVVYTHIVSSHVVHTQIVIILFVYLM